MDVMQLLVELLKLKKKIANVFTKQEVLDMIGDIESELNSI